VIEDPDEGNITNALREQFGDTLAVNRIAEFIHQRQDELQGMFNDIAAAVSEDKAYIWNLFLSLIEEIRLKESRGKLWMNQSEMNKPELSNIGQILISMFENVNWVQEYQWTIKADQCSNLRTREGVDNYVMSNFFRFESGADNIDFQFRFYVDPGDGMMSIFIVIELPNKIKSLRVEMDMKCLSENGEQIFQQWLKPKVISKEKLQSGIRCFHRNILQESMSLKWVFGVKIFDLKKYYLEEAHLVAREDLSQQSHSEDGYNFNERDIAEWSETYNDDYLCISDDDFIYIE